MVVDLLPVVWLRSKNTQEQADPRSVLSSCLGLIYLPPRSGWEHSSRDMQMMETPLKQNTVLLTQLSTLRTSQPSTTR